MRGLAILLLLGSMVVMGYWYFGSQPRHLATLTQKLVTPEGVDEWGDPKKAEWQEVFEPGLDLYGGVAGGMLAIGGILFFVSRRRDRRINADV